MDKEKTWATRYGACGSIQAGKSMEKELMSYGVHFSHKVIQKIRQFQMVHFVFEKVIRRDNIEAITMFAQSKKYFRCIERSYHQILIPELFTFHEEHEFTQWQLYLKYGYLVVVSVKLEYLVIWCRNRKKHPQERSPTWSGSVRRPSGTPGPGSKSKFSGCSLTLSRFTR